MAIDFKPGKDPVLNGDVNVESLSRNMEKGCWMAGGIVPGVSPAAEYAEPGRPDRFAVVDNPAITRITGLAF